MISYKIIVSYDGTDYAGWAPQKNKNSIVQILQDSFAKVFVKDIHILGASRTDAGVHALGQVALFKTDLVVEEKTMLWAWNNILPQSIVIRSLERVADFHPHVNVMQKTYWYHLFVETPLPFYARYGWQAPKFDLDRLHQALQCFVGTHDFHAFYMGDEKGDDTIRIIDAISIAYIPEYKAYRIEISGEKFMRHMIRRMVGAAVAVASRRDVTSDDIMYALQNRTLQKELYTAPAQGLLLYKIDYK